MTPLATTDTTSRSDSSREVVLLLLSTYERVNYDDVEPVSGAMHSLSDSLESEQVGVSIVRCDPGWRNRPHDYSETNYEGIYILLDGRATVVIDDDEVPM